MLLAETTITSTGPVPIESTVITLDGVTTVLAAFIFVCLIMPTLVKHKSQYYAALACVAGIVAVHTAMLLFNWPTLGAVLIGLLQIFGLILLVLCVGGLTLRELGGEMTKAYEVIRRGETEKEVIIPIGDRVPPPIARGKAAPAEAPRKVYKINTPKPPVEEDDEDKGIPLS